MKVANFNGCKVYNLSTGKTMPEWLSQAKKRALAKDAEYQKRLELIQDFEMTTAAQCMTMSGDNEHIIVSGTYPPVVKCFTTNDLAMKFQRGLTSEVVSMQSLSDDFGKIAFLQNDRTINLHAPYGTHYSVRVPKFGRHMVYNWDNCDLCVGGSGNEIYRLNLEGGQFREPFELSYEGCNKLHINPVHQLLSCGGETGLVEFWDPRQRKRVSLLTIKDDINQFHQSTSVTALKFDTDGLTLSVGTNHGNVYLYDIRSKKPLYQKEHQYGLPIVDISYHHSTKSIISTDKKIVKIWERDGPNIGKIMTNVETPAEINDIVFVKDRRGETGLMMIAGEQSRIMTYFIPQLGPAPRWCSFLENLTEELEEATNSTIYEDYKFITKSELEELGATSLLGTPMLKAYMHGFFLEMKLYNKLRAVSKPFEYEEYRKQKVREKIEANRASRISVIKKLPKVNQELAEKLIKQKLKENQKEKLEIEGEMGTKVEKEETKVIEQKKMVMDAKKLIDPRFAAVFERAEFQQNQNDSEYKLRFPVRSQMSMEKEKRRKEAGEDEGDLYEAMEDDEDDMEEQDNEEDDETENEEDDNPDHYNFVDEDDEDEESNHHISEGDEDDDEELESNKKRKRRRSTGGRGHQLDEEEEELGAIARATMKSKLKKMEKQISSQKKMKMFTLNDSLNTDDILFSDKKHLKALQKEERVLANLPIAQRLQQQQQQRQQFGKFSSSPSSGRKGFRKNGFGKDQSQIKVYKSKDQGIVREISFFPSSNRKK